MSRYDIEPLLAVGCEGTFGFLTTLAIMPLLHFYYGATPVGQGGYFDMVTGWNQIITSPTVIWSSIASAVSIALFNGSGLAVTRAISATARSTIDTCRTLGIWVASLFLGWEVLRPLSGSMQSLGFAALVYGTLVFNGIIRPPKFVRPAPRPPMSRGRSSRAGPSSSGGASGGSRSRSGSARPGAGPRSASARGRNPETAQQGGGGSGPPPSASSSTRRPGNSRASSTSRRSTTRQGSLSGAEGDSTTTNNKRGRDREGRMSRKNSSVGGGKGKGSRGSKQTSGSGSDTTGGGGGGGAGGGFSSMENSIEDLRRSGGSRRTTAGEASGDEFPWTASSASRPDV